MQPVQCGHIPILLEYVQCHACPNLPLGPTGTTALGESVRHCEALPLRKLEDRDESSCHHFPDLINFPISLAFAASLA
jgi:hypothetical protein